jgi:apolipoprotein N-acyltransferase
METSTEGASPALAGRLSALTGARLRIYPLLALASGALAVLGFAPYGIFPFAVLAAAGLCEVLSQGTPGLGFRRGWLFGLGLLGLGVAWIRISLNEFGNMDAWIADLAMVLFVSSMAIYYGLVGALARRLDPGGTWVLPVLLLPGLYVLGEWLRGWLFTGFPWLDLGYTQIDAPLGGFAPIAGVYGVGLLTVLSGGLLWGLVRWGWRGRAIAAMALALIWTAGGLLRGVEWTRAEGAPFEATVVQANIPQSMKWDPDALVANIQAYLELTKEHLGSDLIVWPETAVPAFLHEVRKGLVDPLSERARKDGSEIVLGIPVMKEDGRYYNGLLAIGDTEDLYAKRHLVPFGEFMPFKRWVGPIARLFQVPMSDFSAGEDRRPLLKLGPRLAGASICYEDAFPEEVVQAMPEAQFLVNVSNDSWFGDSLAPHQHLEIARMRALENGRWLVRATNTGISAIVDDRGQVAGQIPAFVRGTYSHRVQPRSGDTPFAVVGNWLAIGLAGVLSLAALVLGRLAAQRAKAD